MLLRTFLATIFLNFCLYNYEGTFSPKDLKFGKHVYSYARSKKDTVDHCSIIAFYPLKWHFSILGFLRSGDKKGCKKAHVRPMISIFWQKIPNSIW